MPDATTHIRRPVHPDAIGWWGIRSVRAFFTVDAVGRFFRFLGVLRFVRVIHAQWLGGVIGVLHAWRKCRGITAGGRW